MSTQISWKDDNAASIMTRPDRARLAKQLSAKAADNKDGFMCFYWLGVSQAFEAVERLR